MAIDSVNTAGNPYANAISKEKARTERLIDENYLLQVQEEERIEKALDNRRLKEMDKVDMSEKKRLEEDVATRKWNDRRSEEVGFQSRVRGSQIDVKG